jgi:hypothetical protein
LRWWGEHSGQQEVEGHWRSCRRERRSRFDFITIHRWRQDGGDEEIEDGPGDNKADGDSMAVVRATKGKIHEGAVKLKTN